MLNLILLYFVLLAFWVETVLGFSLSEIKGISLWNLSLSLMLMSVAYSVVKKRELLKPNKVNRYVILLILIVMASVPVKMAMGELEVDLLGEVIAIKSWANPFILFLATVNVLDDKKNAAGVLAGLVAFFGVTVVSSFLVSGGFLKIGVLKVVQEGRVAGFSEPNQYAAFLVLFIPLFAAAVLFGKSKLVKLSATSVCLLALMALIATGSRGGAVCFLVSMLTFIVALQRNRMLGLLPILGALLVFGVTALGAFALAPDPVKKVFQERLNVARARSLDEATSGRTILFRNGIKLFLESPILGHGHNTFVALSKKRFKPYGNSHNDFLLYLVHYGVFGLFVFSMIFLKISQQVRQFMNECGNPRSQLLYISYLAGFAGFVMSMLSVNIMEPLFPFCVYTAFIIRYGQMDLQGAPRLDCQGSPPEETTTTPNRSAWMPMDGLACVSDSAFK